MRKGELGVVAAGVLTKPDGMRLVRLPQILHLGRRIPVGRENDRTVAAAEVEPRVGRRRLGDPFADPVLGAALGTDDIHAAQVVVPDLLRAVAGPECGGDPGGSGVEQAIGSGATLHGDQRRSTRKGGTEKTY